MTAPRCPEIDSQGAQCVLTAQHGGHHSLGNKPAAGSRDNFRTRVVDVDAETVLALIVFPDGKADIKSTLPNDQAAQLLRSAADALEAKS